MKRCVSQAWVVCSTTEKHGNQTSLGSEDRQVFERYTSEAKRAIFFAGSAAQPNGRGVEPEQLLFGLIRENVEFVNRFTTGVPEAWLRDATRAETALNEQVSYSEASQRILSYASEEAARVGRQEVGIEHILLGLLREEGSAAARMLRDHGANIERIREELAVRPYQPPSEEERLRRAYHEIEETLTDEGIELQDLEQRDTAEDRFAPYTFAAYRLIFFAKGAAARQGSPAVETEHLLLAVLKEEEHFNLFLPLAPSREAILGKIEEQTTVRKTGALRAKPSALFDWPLSDECKRILDYANEEATLLGSKRVAPEHLLLGMLREESSFGARILRQHGAELERIRRGLAA